MKKILIKILSFFGIKATERTLNKAHIKSYLQAKIRRGLLSSAASKLLTAEAQEYFGLPLYKQEIIIWRTYNLQFNNQGRECLKKNECPCGCVTSEVLLADASCDKGCFPEMLSLSEWKQFKKKHKFEVDLERKRIILC